MSSFPLYSKFDTMQFYLVHTLFMQNAENSHSGVLEAVPAGTSAGRLPGESM